MWEFKEISEKETEIDFYIDFQFKSKILDMAFSKVFIHAQKTILSNFIERIKNS